MYSAPKEYLGCHLDARADSALVKLYHRGQLVKTHPRAEPGRRVTDPADLPEHKTVYAMRDVASLAAAARRHGDHVGVYAERLLDTDLPWTKMRQVYRLLGLARRYGPGPVDPRASGPWTSTSSTSPRSPRCWRKQPRTPPSDRRTRRWPRSARFARDPAEYRPVQLTLIPGGKDGSR